MTHKGWRIVKPQHNLLQNKKTTNKQKKMSITCSNPEPDLHNINEHAKFGENQFILTQVFTRNRKYGRVAGR